MPIYTSNQWRIQVNVAGVGLDSVSWDKASGGEIVADNQTYNPGSMGPQITVGGIRKRSDITVERAWSDALIGKFIALDTAAGVAAATVSVAPVKADRKTAGVKPDRLHGRAEAGHSTARGLRLEHDREPVAGYFAERINHWWCVYVMSGLDPQALTVSPTQSVAEHLRESFRQRQGNKTKDVRIPGYDGLFVTFRALDDYTEVRDAIKDVARKRGISEGEREVEIAVRTLLLASVSSHAVINDRRVEIDLPLGLGLYDYIFPAEPGEEGDIIPEVRPESDTEAVVMLFDNTMALVVTAASLDQWFRGEGVDTDEEILGN